MRHPGRAGCSPYRVDEVSDPRVGFLRSDAERFCRESDGPAPALRTRLLEELRSAPVGALDEAGVEAMAAAPGEEWGLRLRVRGEGWGLRLRVRGEGCGSGWGWGLWRTGALCGVSHEQARRLPVGRRAGHGPPDGVGTRGAPPAVAGGVPGALCPAFGGPDPAA
ncbi:hypothetical protein SUDANB176_05055 [Streptomyces sp. enrichment culture]